MGRRGRDAAGIAEPADQRAAIDGSINFALTTSTTWANRSSNATAINSGFVAPAASVTTPLTLTVTGTSFAEVKAANFYRDGAGATLALIFDSTNNTQIAKMNVAQSYTGGTTIRGGSVRTETTGALGTGVIRIGDTTGAGSGTLSLFSAAQTFANDVIVQAGNTGTSGFPPAGCGQFRPARAPRRRRAR